MAHQLVLVTGTGEGTRQYFPVNQLTPDCHNDFCLIFIHYVNTLCQLYKYRGCHLSLKYMN
jgi:hypothetical protein